VESFTEEQKRYTIDRAKKSYEIALEERRSNDDPDALINHGLQESCLRISSLVHYIVKYKYDIPDENNKVYHCIFTFNEVNSQYKQSHFINCVNGMFIDASIEQFNTHSTNINFSPYDCNEEYYMNLEKAEPLCEEAIKEEIEAFDVLDYFRDKISSKNKPTMREKEVGKMPRIIGIILKALKLQR
jgi:hypothetical protein